MLKKSIKAVVSQKLTELNVFAIVEARDRAAEMRSSSPLSGRAEAEADDAKATLPPFLPFSPQSTGSDGVHLKVHMA